MRNLFCGTGFVRIPGDERKKEKSLLKSCYKKRNTD